LLVLSWKRRCWPLVLLSLCLIYKSLLMSIRLCWILYSMHSLLFCLLCSKLCQPSDVIMLVTQPGVRLVTKRAALLLDVLQCLDLTLASWIPYSCCVFDGWSHNCGVACLLDCPRAFFQVTSNKSKSSISFGSYVVHI
jgi:hypothetical protein